jgi:hypothetical protein
MNTTMIIVELLDWDGRLKTLTFSPSDGPNLWVALVDEYNESRSGPFYFLEPEDECKFSAELKRRQSRLAGRYRETTDGVFQFRTDWKGVPTLRTGLSCYALCLPPDAVPDIIEFTDPRMRGRRYRHRAMYDNSHGRVVVYLDCRSKHGSFDFDLDVTFHRDHEACESFRPVSADPNGPNVGKLASIAGRRPSGGRNLVVQQFFAPAGDMIIGDKFENIGTGAVVVNRSTLEAALNGAGAGYGDETARALAELALMVVRENQPDAIEILNALNGELARPQPDRVQIGTYLHAIESALPRAKDAATVTAKIAALVNN